MKKKYTIGIKVFLSLFFISMFCWFISTCCNEKFWNVSFYEILNISLTVILAVIGFSITVLIVEEKNDNRRYIDAIAQIIDKIDLIIVSNDLIPESVLIDSDEYKKMISCKKNLSNYIDILAENCTQLDYKEELDFIKLKFHDYETIINTCCESKLIASDTKVKIELLINLISQKLFSIRIKLYKPKNK